MTMLRRTVLPAALTAVVLAVPAVAALPKFKDRTIVIGKSIGGVKLGATPASAKKAWGASGAQCFTGSCRYRVSKNAPRSGEGTFEFPGGKKIVRITLSTAVKGNGTRVYKTPFTTPKTSKGIGIGSSLASLKRVHPTAKKTSDSLRYAIRKGGTETVFRVAGEPLRIASIEIQTIMDDE